MAKGDDTIAKKRNKVMRKKQNSKTDRASVSARVAAIIATKKRRKSGKRRQCEGMCFSLPTLDDPYNDRNGKPLKSKISKKKEKSEWNKKKSDKEKETSPKKSKSNADVDELEKINEMIRSLKTKKQIKSSLSVDDSEKWEFEKSCRPSKFLMMCLTEIRDGLFSSGNYSQKEEKCLLSNHWGAGILRSFASGNDILWTDGSEATREQIAWIACTAAEKIARNQKAGLSVSGAFLLYLVSSQEKTVKVRSVSKHLKSLGLHSVSLHPGASIDHQISGLKSCEPEFIVSTPERLLELVALKAVDVSSVSLLVIDGLESLCDGGYLDNVKSISQTISGKCCTMIFNDGSSQTSNEAAESLLKRSVCRLSLHDTENKAL
ncbi:hypothetical protein ACFE04_010222 [Oxalis oulophora]